MQPKYNSLQEIVRTVLNYGLLDRKLQVINRAEIPAWVHRDVASIVVKVFLVNHDKVSSSMNQSNTECPAGILG